MLRGKSSVNESGMLARSLSIGSLPFENPSWALARGSPVRILQGLVRLARGAVGRKDKEGCNLFWHKTPSAVGRIGFVVDFEERGLAVVPAVLDKRIDQVLHFFIGKSRADD